MRLTLIRILLLWRVLVLAGVLAGVPGRTPLIVLTRTRIRELVFVLTLTLILALTHTHM